MMIYALLSAPKDSGRLALILNGMRGISGTVLSSVAVDGINAIVCEATRANTIADRSNAIAFAAIIETLSHDFTLLPMRFGSMMDSSEAIASMVKRNYTEIHSNLQKIENKFEFGLKVLCDSEKLRADLIRKSEADNNISSSLTPEAPTSIYRDWVNRKLKEHRLEELLLTHVDAVVTTITTHLSSMNADCKFKKMLTETTIIDALILLKKELKPELMTEISNLQVKYPGLNFILTGPWPPYNFVDFIVK